MRAFIAIPLDDPIRRALGKAIDRLRATPAKVRWVDPAKAHITLVFLGDLEDDVVTLVAEEMEDAVEGVEPFEIAFAGVGSFGRPARPAVVWAGLKENAPALSHLHDRMDRGMGTLGLGQQKRPFQAHITLGRVKGTKEVDRLLAAIEREAETDFGTMTVETVQLMMSTLTPRGAEYTVMSTVPLRGR